MKILVTGSRGFIGGSIARFAARHNHQVLGIGRSSQREADWPGEYVQADVVSADLSPIIREFAPEVVFHAAGTASVGASLKSPLDDLRAAMMTWANTLDGVRRSELQPLILFPSSAAVYGNPPALPVKESAPLDPISPYGFHKAACELLAREYSFCFGLNIIVCRLFSVFGTAQRRLLVWELFKQFTNCDSTAWVDGTGAETRDYLAVDDVAAAMFHLIESQPQAQQNEEEARCLFVNIASGEETSVLELARLIGEMIAPEKEIQCRGRARRGDPQRWRADTSRLCALAPSWQPFALRENLSKCLAAWQKEFDSLRYEG